jgi:hypothetical protein
MSLPTLADLKSKLPAHVDQPVADEHTDDAAAEALELATTLAGSRAEAIPVAIAMRGCLEVAADLYYRRTARNGIVGLNSLEVQPVRINRDPLTAVRPLWAPYLGPGIA